MKLQLTFAVLLIGALTITEAGPFGPDDHNPRPKGFGPDDHNPRPKGFGPDDHNPRPKGFGPDDHNPRPKGFGYGDKYFNDNSNPRDFNYQFGKSGNNFPQQLNFSGFFSAVINMKPIYPTKGGYNSTAKFDVQSDGPRRPHYISSFGIVQIFFGKDRKGYICNGVHLKAWLILVPAQCVYERDINKLEVRVLVKQGTGAELKKVKVLDRSFHPKYNPPRADYNFAMLFIGGKMSWDVQPFNVEKERFKTETLLSKGIQTKVDEIVANNRILDDPYFYVGTFNRNVTKDFEVCDELGEAANWYCAERGASRSKLRMTDVGSPIYYFKSPKDKRLLGIYTGRHAGMEMNGHVFEAIHPAVEFIERYVSLRSSPEMYGP